MHRDELVAGGCSLKTACTAGRARRVTVNFDEPGRQHPKQLPNTVEYQLSRREPKKVEALFAELKDVIKLRRFRLRRYETSREQMLMAAAGRNIRRLVRFLKAPLLRQSN